VDKKEDKNITSASTVGIKKSAKQQASVESFVTAKSLVSSKAKFA
jgi:hypothetical protein